MGGPRPVWENRSVSTRALVFAILFGLVPAALSPALIPAGRVEASPPEPRVPGTADDTRTPAPSPDRPRHTPPEALAYRDALNRTQADWVRFLDGLDPLARKLDAFRERSALYIRATGAGSGRAGGNGAGGPGGGAEGPEEAEDAGAAVDSLRASRLLGWDAGASGDPVAALAGALGALERARFFTRSAQAAALLDSLRREGRRFSNAAEFARARNPRAAAARLPEPVERMAALLAAGARDLDAVRGGLPPLADVALWRETWKETAEAFAAASGSLAAGLAAFPADSLCGAGPGSGEAIRVFLGSAAGRDGIEDCAVFRAASAWPRLGGMVWESPGHLFLFDPRRGEGFLVDRDRAALAYRWSRLLEKPPPLDPARFTAYAQALDPGARRRAGAEAEAFGRWRREETSLIEGLGLTRRFDLLTALPAETFAARALLDPGFAAALDSLGAIHDGHASVEGRVLDGASLEPLAGAQVVLTGSGPDSAALADAGGRFRVVFAGRPGRPYRTVIRAAGYQTLTEAGLLPARVVAGREFRLSPVPRAFAVEGTVRRRGSSAVVPAPGATVTVESGGGTSARAVTGADGAYRLVVQAPPRAEVRISATLGEAADTTMVTALGSERTGVDFELAAGEGMRAVVRPPGPVVEREGPGSPVVTVPPEPGDDGEAADDAASAAGGGGGSPGAARAGAASATAAGTTAAAAEEEEAAAAMEEGMSDDAEPAAALLAAGDPFTRTTVSGSCAVGDLFLDVAAGAFPARIEAGRRFPVKVGVRWEPGPDSDGRARVLVRAFFFDAPPQNTTLDFAAGGTRTVTFTFDAGDAAADSEGTVGVGVGGRFPCPEGPEAQRVAVAYQSYRRAP